LEPTLQKHHNKNTSTLTTKRNNNLSGVHYSCAVDYVEASDLVVNNLQEKRFGAYEKVEIYKAIALDIIKSMVLTMMKFSLL